MQHFLQHFRYIETRSNHAVTGAYVSNQNTDGGVRQQWCLALLLCNAFRIHVWDRHTSQWGGTRFFLHRPMYQLYSTRKSSPIGFPQASTVHPVQLAFPFSIFSPRIPLPVYAPPPPLTKKTTTTCISFKP